MAGLVEFAENELNMLLKSCKDSESLKMQKAVNNDILDIIKLFSGQGHSGFSASYTLNILKRLLDYKPLSPITGEKNEWVELNYSPDLAYQSKRCPSIFKDADGKVYNVEAKVFSDDGGHTWYNCKDSREYVELPYEVPAKPEYVVIDNKQERQGILINICNLIIALGGKIEEFDDVTEETKLEEVLDNSKFEELEQKLIETYYITEPLFSLKDCEEPKMWEVINIVTKSNREMPEKEK